MKDKLQKHKAYIKGKKHVKNLYLFDYYQIVWPVLAVFRGDFMLKCDLKIISAVSKVTTTLWFGSSNPMRTIHVQIT